MSRGNTEAHEAGRLYAKLPIPQARQSRGAVTLSVVDPFELQHFTFTTRDRTHVQLGSSTFSARRATLGFSYTFGHVSRRNGRHRSADGQPQSQAPDIR